MWNGKFQSNFGSNTTHSRTWSININWDQSRSKVHSSLQINVATPSCSPWRLFSTHIWGLLHHAVLSSSQQWRTRIDQIWPSESSLYKHTDVVMWSISGCTWISGTGVRQMWVNDKMWVNDTHRRRNQEGTGSTCPPQFFSGQRPQLTCIVRNARNYS